MKPPPFLLGASLLFWGWQTGLLAAGAAMAVVIESARWIPARWEFSEDDFHRIRTFCSVLALAALTYAFATNEGPTDFINFLQQPGFFAERNAGAAGARTVAALLRWLPMIFFLLICAQIFSSRGGVPLETLSLVLRNRAKKARKLGQRWPATGTVDLRYAYFGLCLFSSSIHAGVEDSSSFFWGLSALTGWTLWQRRSKRFGLALWVGTLLAAILLGYAGERSLGKLQGWFATFNPRWFARAGRGGADPLRARTAIGMIGVLKGSGKIVVRLEPEDGSSAPALLREASYRTYRDREKTWYSESSTNDFFGINPADSNKTSYVLVPKTNIAAVNIACYLPGGRGLLPLPHGAGRLDNLSVFEPPQRNGLGAVLAEGPGLVIFDAQYGPGPTMDSAPNTNLDLFVPPKEEAALVSVISEFHFAGLTRDQTLRAISQMFQDKFTYRIWRQRYERIGPNETQLGYFLLSRRSGHCEYFASATVLLLRELHIPARYAVGYAVHEAHGSKYLVRQRDAHAWCLVWNDHTQRWQDFDTTPGSWLAVESSRASPFERLSDLWSNLMFEWAKLRWGQTRLPQYFLWILLPIMAFMLRQIIFRRRRRLGRSAKPNDTVWPGRDSEFYAVERKLAQRGLPRRPSEPLSEWLTRAADAPDLAPVRAPLRELLLLHYRYRFDPGGLSDFDRETLRRESQAFLARLDAKTAPIAE